MAPKDTADHRGRLGIDCAVTNREITSRDDTGRVVVAAGPVVSLALTTSRRWLWPERVPWPAAPIALRRTLEPPLWSARA